MDAASLGRTCGIVTTGSPFISCRFHLALPRAGVLRRVALTLLSFVAGVALLRSGAWADEPANQDRNAQAPSTGKLFICGGGTLPGELYRQFVDLSGGSAARVVVITTASALADSDRIQATLNVWRELPMANLTVLHTRSRETADEAQFVKPLTDATGVWFGGGDQNRLIDTYLGTATEREIRGVLTRGGVVGGTSAGAAVMSPVMIRRDKPTVECGAGFGFLPGTVVDQHFLKRNRKKRLLQVLEEHRDFLGLGIDEGTALVVSGGRLRVLGESQVLVCWPPVAGRPDEGITLEAAGPEIDLMHLHAQALARLEPKPASPDAADVAASTDEVDVTTVGVTPEDTGGKPAPEEVGQ
ncbi:MAG TPA: cyanophycinase [Pirellulales bacterium]|nr:cyanophycinase [Pirellulales bacterium]